MRKIILLWFLFNAHSILAQTGITGFVKDNETHAVEFANILLFQSHDTLNLYKGAITDSVGFFKLTDVPTGKYRIKIQFIGFAEKKLWVEKQSNQNLETGIITLLTNNKILSTVEIKGKRDLIQKTTKGLVVNADAILAQQGGTAVDVLRNTPTIFVDAEGGVSMRGKSPLILINGRNSKLNNLANIPASSIEKIEIITNPSAEYDAEAESGIINIVLKKGKEEGLNGAFSTGLGYGAKGRFNSSALLNYKKKAWNVGFGYDNRLAERNRKATGDRINFNLPSQYFLTQRRNDDRNEETHNLRVNLDFENQKYILNAELLSAIENETNLETLFSTFEKQTREFNSKNRRFSEEIRKSNIYEGALTLQRKFKDKNKKLSFNLTSSFNRGTENTSIATNYLTTNNQETGTPFSQKTTFGEKSNIANARVDYAGCDFSMMYKIPKLSCQTNE